jgi:hypothetical protein
MHFLTIASADLDLGHIIPESNLRKSAQSVDDPVIDPQISQISADLDLGHMIPESNLRKSAQSCG